MKCSKHLVVHQGVGCLVSQVQCTVFVPPIFEANGVMEKGVCRCVWSGHRLEAKPGRPASLPTPQQCPAPPHPNAHLPAPPQRCPLAPPQHAASAAPAPAQHNPFPPAQHRPLSTHLPSRPGRHCDLVFCRPSAARTLSPATPPCESDVRVTPDPAAAAPPGPPAVSNRSRPTLC